MRGDPEKGGQGRPGQADTACAVERVLKPGPRRSMEFARVVGGIEEDVGVDDHWPSSASSNSSASATLDTSTLNPSACVRCRKCLLSGFARNPARASSLTASLRPMLF